MKAIFAWTLSLLCIGGSNPLRTAPLISGSLERQAALQKALIERIYAVKRQAANQALLQLQSSDFRGSVALHDERGYPRKFIWDFFAADYNCPLRERVGDDGGNVDGGKWVCGVDTLLQKRDCVIYSFGSAGDTAFEEALLRRARCSVHVFDPTLSAEKRDQVAGIPGIKLHTYGLSHADGDLTKGDPELALHTGGSPLPVKTLGKIMTELNHSWVDILKIDIEGSEWQVLEQLTSAGSPLPFTQLQVEFHHWGSKGYQPRKMLRVLHRLVNKGSLRVFNVEPNIWQRNNGYDFVEYAFIQVDRSGDIVTGP